MNPASPSRSEIARVKKAVFPLLNAADAKSAGKCYPRLTLCLIDAVYSITVRYEGVEKVVRNYCCAYGLDPARVPIANLPRKDKRETISELVRRIEEVGPQEFAEKLLKNRWRTSPTNGILKAEALLETARILKKHGIEHLQDAPKLRDNQPLEDEFRQVPGQRSGISFKYFLMETGMEDYVKPDRMLLNWLAAVLERSVSGIEAQQLIGAVSSELRPKAPHASARFIDFLIWQEQRRQQAAAARDWPSD